jgi:prolyl-tRNA synthetase
MPINVKQDEQRKLSEELYESLNNKRYEVLYDDRAERPGVKFKDADLFGLPLRITVGKKAEEGILEVKIRKTGEVLEVHRDNLLEIIEKYIG